MNDPAVQVGQQRGEDEGRDDADAGDASGGAAEQQWGRRVAPPAQGPAPAGQPVATVDGDEQQPTDEGEEQVQHAQPVRPERRGHGDQREQRDPSQHGTLRADGEEVDGDRDEEDRTRDQQDQPGGRGHRG